MARHDWNRQDVDDRLTDATQQLREATADPATFHPHAVETIRQNIDWLLDKRNRTS